ncbi:MAG: hypothetical protein QG671_2163, partial [Actinomycetota bacterium]|nr:hypothetical protein [Actinomycetota bacterium]
WQSDAADVVKQLESHSETLRLDGSARLRDAVSGRDLVSKLVNEHDDLVVVEALANAALPAEPQPIAKSLSSARVVAASLKGAAWQVLDGVAELVASDREAAAIFDGLWSAAAASELHVTLEPALRSAGAACSRLLTEQFKKGREEEDARRRAEEAEQRRIQAAREEQERQDEARRAEDEHRRLEEQARLERERASSDARHDLDAIELDDVDAALARVADAVKTGLKSAPGKKLRVQWWLE